MDILMLCDITDLWNFSSRRIDHFTSGRYIFSLIESTCVFEANKNLSVRRSSVSCNKLVYLVRSINALQRRFVEVAGREFAFTPWIALAAQCLRQLMFSCLEKAVKTPWL